MKQKEHKAGPNNLHVLEMIPDKQTYPYPLVLVHGSFGGAFMWRIIGEYLVKNGFHCYALSLRGHTPNDTSAIGTFGMEDYEQDVKDVIDSFGLENPVVIGHSMSGLVALMYAVGNQVSALVSIGPSPSKEIQGESDPQKIKSIPDVYTPMEAGMPSDPMEVMKVLPDIPQEMLMKMKDMLGPESGKARRDRKSGISITKESVTFPYLVFAGEIADSVKFGVPPESSRAMAEYYNADFVQIKGATHPGILMGEHAMETAKVIADWLVEQAP